MFKSLKQKVMKTIHTNIILMLILALSYGSLFSQSYGPFNPANNANNNSVGVNDWTNHNRVISSNNSYSTVSTFGFSKYVEGSNFGFALLPTDVVTGIQVDIEKASTAMQNVSLLNAWATGTNRPLSAGTNRMLIVNISFENATARNITNVTYGGRALTQLFERDLFTTFYAKTEIWGLMEADLALCVGTNITFTYAASVPVENFEIISSAVYQNVDQVSAINHTTSSTRNGGAGAYQITPALSTLVGSMSIMSVFCGNPPSPMQALGNSNAFSVNSGFTERIDFHVANAGAAATGGVSQISDKSSVAIGTEQPSFTFTGTTNRLVAVGISLRRARQFDNNVSLRKAAGYVGSNKALAGVDWPTSDTYVTYGGAGDLWGTTWTFAEINDPSFGAGISVEVRNGTANIDNIRVTVFVSSILPIELISFSTENINETVNVTWATASERENDYFQLEHSRDGSYWQEVAIVKGAGNSSEKIDYSYVDKTPFYGKSYYRLTQYDINGVANQLGTLSNELIVTKYLIYPVPVNKSMFLEGDNLMNSEIFVVNSVGEIIDVEQTIVGDKISFNFSDVKNGAYFLTIENDKTKKTERISVVHK